MSSTKSKTIQMSLSSVSKKLYQLIYKIKMVRRMTLIMLMMTLIMLCISLWSEKMTTATTEKMTTTTTNKFLFITAFPRSTTTSTTFPISQINKYNNNNNKYNHDDHFRNSRLTFSSPRKNVRLNMIMMRKSRSRMLLLSLLLPSKRLLRCEREIERQRNHPIIRLNNNNNDNNNNQNHNREIGDDNHDDNNDDTKTTATTATTTTSDTKDEVTEQDDKNKNTNTSTNNKAKNNEQQQQNKNVTNNNNDNNNTKEQNSRFTSKISNNSKNDNDKENEKNDTVDNDHDHDDWVVGNVERDFNLLEQAIIETNKDETLLQNQRVHLLNYLSSSQQQQQRIPLISFIQKNVLYPLFLSYSGIQLIKLVQTILIRYSYYYYHNTVSPTTIMMKFIPTISSVVGTISILYFGCVTITIPMFYYLYYSYIQKRRQHRKSNQVGGISESIMNEDDDWNNNNNNSNNRMIQDYNQYTTAVVSSNAIKNTIVEHPFYPKANYNTSCQDYILCLLEQWMSVIGGYVLVGTSFFFMNMYHHAFGRQLGTNLVQHPLSSLAFLNHNNNNNKIFVLVGLFLLQICIRFGVWVSQHQYIKLQYELYRSNQPRPITYPVWFVQTISSIQYPTFWTILDFINIGILVAASTSGTTTTTSLLRPPSSISIPNISKWQIVQWAMVLTTVFGPLVRKVLRLIGDKDHRFHFLQQSLQKRWLNRKVHNNDTNSSRTAAASMNLKTTNISSEVVVSQIVTTTQASFSRLLQKCRTSTHHLLLRIIPVAMIGFVCFRIMESTISTNIRTMILPSIMNMYNAGHVLSLEQFIHHYSRSILLQQFRWNVVVGQFLIRSFFITILLLGPLVHMVAYVKLLRIKYFHGLPLTLDPIEFRNKHERLLSLVESSPSSSFVPPTAAATTSTMKGMQLAESIDEAEEDEEEKEAPHSSSPHQQLKSNRADYNNNNNTIENNSLNHHIVVDDVVVDNDRYMWRIMVRWREPVRVRVTIRNWRRNIMYWLFFSGSVEEKVRKELRQQQSSKNRLSYVQQRNLTIWQRFAADIQMTKTSSSSNSNSTNTGGATIIDRSTWKTTAMQNLAKKHQLDYEQNNIEDPLGIAIQQTFGIGLGYNFDHMSKLQKDEIPSTRRLQARAAKSALRRSQIVYNPQRVRDAFNQIPESMNNNKTEEQNRIRQEFRNATDHEIQYLTQRLTELVPTDFVLGTPSPRDSLDDSTSDYSSSGSSNTRVEQYSYNYERVGENEYVIDAPSSPHTTTRTRSSGSSSVDFLYQLARKNQRDNDGDGYEMDYLNPNRMITKSKSTSSESVSKYDIIDVEIDEEDKARKNDVDNDDMNEDTNVQYLTDEEFIDAWLVQQQSQQNEKQQQQRPYGSNNSSMNDEDMTTKTKDMNSDNFLDDNDDEQMVPPTTYLV